MYTAIALIALLLTITTTTTISASPTTRHLSRRGLPGAYYTCTNPNFAGECSWTQPNTECHIQGSPAGIESLGPDEGTICTLYTGFDCKGQAIKDVHFPGIATGLPEFGSFNCSNASGPRKTGFDVAAQLADSLLNDGELRDFGLKAVKSAGREQGMIGLKKGVYY